MRITAKQALINWNKFKKDLERQTPVDRTEKAADKIARVKRLEADDEAWMKYYFPGYCKKPFAPWQSRYIKASQKKGKRFIVRKVFRGGAKTTLTQMLMCKKVMTRSVRNMLWVSKNLDAAIEMIRVLRLQFEGNPRLINDYGEQKNLGAWGDEKFVLRNGASIRALGKGQSPRGAKEEEARPDCIVWDDGDDDEEVRNKTRLDNTYDWCMGALFGCFSVGGDNLFIGLGNKIAQDCIIERLSLVADDCETVNLLNEKGQPTCPKWFTLADCLYMMEKMGTRLAQREYQNNPIVEGKVFKTEWVQYKPMRALSVYGRALVSYNDPSFKNKKNADHKALVLMGLVGHEIHIVKAWCGLATVHEMVMWHYELDQYLKARSATAEMYMEEVFLQDLLYDDFNKVAEEMKYPIPIRGDKRKKPDKDARIESLGGHWERGNWYFNELEKENHHMQRLITQFTLFEMGLNGIKKDGPDACEGAYVKLKEKIFLSSPAIIGSRKSTRLY